MLVIIIVVSVIVMTIHANSYGFPVRLTDFLAFGGLTGVGLIPYG